MAADEPKSLEMRVAELEDRLKGMSFTPEELSGYRKVAGALGAGASLPHLMMCFGHYICAAYPISFPVQGSGPGPTAGQGPAEGSDPLAT